MNLEEIRRVTQQATPGPERANFGFPKDPPKVIANPGEPVDHKAFWNAVALIRMMK